MMKRFIGNPRFILFLLLSSVFSFSAAGVSLTKEQLFQMATAAAKDGSYETAADLYKKVLDADPGFSPAYNSLGLVYQSMDPGHLDEPIRYFQLATGMDPHYVEAWNNLGRAYYNQGRFSEAKAAFLNSLKEREEQPDIHLALAWVYLLGESDPDPAISHFKKAVSVLDNDMAHYGLGLAYLLAGDKFKVLEEITTLRKRQKTPEANALEKMVQGNAKISSTRGKPLVTGRDLGGSVFDKELASVKDEAEKADQAKKGIRVRLTEPLW